MIVFSSYSHSYSIRSVYPKILLIFSDCNNVVFEVFISIIIQRVFFSVHQSLLGFLLIISIVIMSFLELVMFQTIKLGLTRLKTFFSVSLISIRTSSLRNDTLLISKFKLKSSSIRVAFLGFLLFDVFSKCLFYSNFVELHEIESIECKKTNVSTEYRNQETFRLIWKSSYCSIHNYLNEKCQITKVY